MGQKGLIQKHGKTRQIKFVIMSSNVKWGPLLNDEWIEVENNFLWPILSQNGKLLLVGVFLHFPRQIDSSFGSLIFFDRIDQLIILFQLSFHFNYDPLYLIYHIFSYQFCFQYANFLNSILKPPYIHWVTDLRF